MTRHGFGRLRANLAALTARLDAALTARLDVADLRDHRPDAPVSDRSVTLRDPWSVKA